MTQPLSSNPPAAQWLEMLLSYLWEQRGTDLHLTAGSAPLARVDGELHAVPNQPVLTPADTEGFAESLLDDSDRKTFEERGDVDFAFGFDHLARVRGSAYAQRGSTTLALRMIPSRIPDMDELGLPETIQHMVDAPSGLILVTGPTGSGKSTTMASMIDHISRTRFSHVLTIEDPIEYVFRHGQGAVNQREVGRDTESFARGLRSALREDPDVLMVGEMRDLESIDTVLTLAETGHLVIATLHTNDTTQAVDRLVGVFPGEQQNQTRLQLSASLVGVVYQRLLPRREGGLVAAYEILKGTIAVRNLIRESNSRQLRNAITMGQADGMQTLEMHLSQLVTEGIINRDEAVHRSLFPKEIARPQVVPAAV
jgi:twitching motility protein PilT